MKIIQNPNKDFVEQMLKALKENSNYCPCKTEKTKDTKCICKEFRDAPWPGECHCGLYIKEEIDK